MKILFVSTLYPNSIVPTRALYNRRHFEAIRCAGHDVEVIAPVSWYPGKKKLPPLSETIGGIKVHHPRFFYTPGLFIHHHWRSYRLAVKGMLKHTTTSKIHVVLGFAYPDAVAMAEVCESMALPYSVLVLGSDFRVRTQQPKFQKPVMNCLQRSPRIFCPGKALKQDMVEAGLNEDKIFPFNNGVEPGVFFYEKKNIKSENLGKSILFVGNLVDVKAPSRLIRTFAKLAERNTSSANDEDSSLKLIIIGDGPLKTDLKKLCTKLKIREAVHFLGRQSPSIVADKMRKASCLCLCSKSEGMPNVIVEALSCGCPVVATSVGEVPFLIKNGSNGYAVQDANQAEKTIVAKLSKELELTVNKTWDRKAIADGMGSYTWEEAAEVVLTNLHR